MRFRNSIKCLTLFLIVGLLSACNPWDEHIKVNDSTLDVTALKVLRQQPDLSTFVRMLAFTGYDSVLVHAQAYTIFAPTNDAWAGIDTSNLTLMRSYVKNHLAFQSYSLTSNVFTVNRIKMLNGKNLTTSGSSIDGVTLSQSNILAGNGVVHKVPAVLKPKMNIWQYITQGNYSNNAQVAFLKSQADSVMDMELSYKLYLDSIGRPIYDTVWTQTNPWLNRYAINNEDSSYTFILLDETSFENLRQKYSPYFTVYHNYFSTELKKTITEKSDSLTLIQVTSEITRDMILLPVTVTGNQTILSVDGVKVNILGVPDVSYDASNGKVYEVAFLDVKMYQNKVKEVFIEGEDYTSTNVAGTMISKRLKPWASGGYDVSLSGRDRYNSKDFWGLGGSTYYTTANNSSFQFNPILNSVPYRVYYMSYDDLSSHVADTVPMSSKLFFSSPGAPALSYSSGNVYNNFSDTIVFIGKQRAGTFGEVQFKMWAISKTTPGYRLAGYELQTHVDYQMDQMPCISYGRSSLWFSNSASGSGTYSGTLFLDYIRLVPVVDPDE